MNRWFNQLHGEQMFNGVVLIRRDGEIQLARGYGFRDHQKEHLLTPDTPLRIASLSKQFTAAAIIFLNEQQKLKYDDLIKQYIPEIPYKNVTLRHLLNQTSGIPDIYLDVAKANKNKFKILTNKIAVELLVTENRPPQFTPNDKFQYSNTNYILLARIVEIIAGYSFEEFMQATIFGPLKMTNTRVWNLKSTDIADTVLAEDMEFDNKQLKKITPTFIDGVAGDGGVFTSLNDLIIWDDFWSGKLLLNAEELQVAFEKNILNDGSISPYGFGWMLTKNGMWHNGSWLGARSVFVRNPDKKSCYAIIDNCSNIYFDQITREVASVNQKVQ